MANLYTRPLDGPRYSETFIGVVKDNTDAQTLGRLRVWIPELTSDEEDEQGWILVSYCSPFAGVTNYKANKDQNLFDFNNTQISYGMWMIPPDINNEVLIVFANKRTDRGFWIGCLYAQHMNHMIPAIAKGTAYQTSSLSAEDRDLPLAEYNKYEPKPKIIDPMRPQATWRTQGIADQGLINDEVRGVTTSSAKRESPSQVYGILTPGPLNPESNPAKPRNRTGGNSFVMDDGEDSEYVGFRTRSGASLRIDETNGLMYAINKLGTAWFQMDEEGNVDIFGAKSISIRSQENINMRADKDINIEAGQNIYMKAAKDTDSDLNIVGEGAGEGGDIFVQALKDIHVTARENGYLTIEEKDLNIKVKNDTVIQTENDLDIKASNDTKITTDSNFDLKVGGKMVQSSGGSLGINASNFDVQTSGNVKAAGDMFAKDFRSPQYGLNEHEHMYNPGPGSSIPTASHMGGGGSTGDGPTATVADEATPSEVKEMEDKTNVLVDFVDPPKNFERKTEEVKTTVDRFMTYEPCPEHKNKGGQ